MAHTPKGAGKQRDAMMAKMHERLPDGSLFLAATLKR